MLLYLERIIEGEMNVDSTLLLHQQSPTGELEHLFETSWQEDWVDRAEVQIEQGKGDRGARASGASAAGDQYGGRSFSGSESGKG